MKSNVLLETSHFLKADVRRLATAKSLSCLAAVAALILPVLALAESFVPGVFYRDGDGVYESIGHGILDDSSEKITFDIKMDEEHGFCPKGWKIKNVYNLKDGMENLSADRLDDFISEGTVVEATWSLSGSTLTISAKSGFTWFAVVYTPWLYSIAFNKNASDASGSTAGMSKLSYTNTAVKLTANGFSRTGYAFAGWAKSSDGAMEYANQAMVSGESLGVSKDDDTITLYAKWTANNYSISYSYDGGTAGASHPTSVSYDSVFRVSKPTKVGNVFKGWKVFGHDSSTAKSGTSETSCATSIPTTDNIVAATDDVYFLNLTPTAGEIVTLTAQWSPLTTTISFSGEGASSSTPARDIEYGQTTSGYRTVDVPKRENAQFLGYFTEKDGGVQYFDSTGHLMQTWDIAETAVTLYAHWQVNYDRTVTLNLNGGSLDQTKAQITIGRPYGDLPVATWKDYKKAFAGWSTDESGGTVVTPSDIVPDPAPDTLYAQWTNTWYQVRFNGNNSTSGEMENQSVEFNVSTPLTKNGYSRTGYTFAGWATNAVKTISKWVIHTNIVEEGVEIVTNITEKLEDFQVAPDVIYTNCATVLDLATAADATVEFYAVWATNTYYVAFDANGGSGTMPTLTNSYDVAFTLPANKYTQDASKFLAFDHWLDEATGTTYDNGATVLNLTGEDKATVTLKAIWKSSLSDLSTAMHCTTLNWENYTSGSTKWAPHSASGAGYCSDSCARQENQTVAMRSPMVAEIEATEQKDSKWQLLGVLSFRWKPSDVSAKLQWGVSGVSNEYPNAMSDFDVTATGTDWIYVRQKIDVLMPSQKLVLFFDNLTAESPGTYECIDQMTWTPGYPAPTAADAVTVASFSAATDGAGWTLSYAGNDDFAYRVLYTDSLTSPVVWQPYGVVTNTGATVQSFEIKREASVSTRFFKIETIQRQ